jgi:hypothetical protein
MAKFTTYSTHEEFVNPINGVKINAAGFTFYNMGQSAVRLINRRSPDYPIILPSAAAGALEQNISPFGFSVNFHPDEYCIDEFDIQFIGTGTRRLLLIRKHVLGV